LVTYDGTLAANNFSTYVGTSPATLTLPGTTNANFGSIALGSSATILIGNDNVAATSRALGNGSIADVEVWSGIVAIPEPTAAVLMRMGSLAGILILRRRRN
jgi:hypothetical protein